MNLSLSRSELCSYYCRLLNNFFPDTSVVTNADMDKILDVAIDRLDFCFKHVAFKRYNNDSGTLYNHLYADHNIVFTWFLANTAYKTSENQQLSSKLYYLNKAL